MLLTARYVLPVAAPHIENGAVLVRGDTIVEIGAGRGGKTLLLQASALASGAALWSVDTDLSTAAVDLGIGYG
jgi:hypothetical protein